MIRSPIAWVLLAVAVFLLLFGGRPGFRDGAHFYGPLFQYVYDELASGRLPLWNPYENLGQPLAASPTTMLFYPGTWAALLAVWIGAATGETAYTLFTAGHLLLALLTAYRLARCFRCSRHGATLAAVAYALGGGVLFQWNNVPFLVGAAWLPEALLRADRVLRRPSFRTASALGLVVALTVLGGDPQAAYHAGLCSGVMLLFSCRKLGPARTRRVSGFFLVAALLASGLAAVQVLPAWELGRLSDRALPSHQAATRLFSVAPWHLAEFFWPDFGGRSFPVNTRWFSALPGDTEIWVPSLYMGLVPALLALLAAVRMTKQKHGPALAAIAVLFLLGAMGKWCCVYSVFQALPGYATFRFPAKLTTVATLAVAISAARGFDRLDRDESFQRRFRRVYRTIVGAGVLVAATLLLDPLRLFGRVPVCPLFGPFDVGAARHGLIGTALGVSMAYMLYEIASRRPSRKHVLLGLVLFDLFAANAWMLAVRSRDVEPGPPAVERSMERDPIVPVRIYRFPTWYPAEFGEACSTGRLAEAARWDRETLFPRYPLPRRWNVVDVRGTLMPKDYYAAAGKIRSEWKYGEPGQAERSLESLGVRYVLAPGAAELDADRIPLGEDGPADMSLWKLRHPAERRFLVYEPNRLEFEHTRDTPGPVVLLEQAWPGWRAFCNGKEIPVREVDGIFRAVDLPAGTHRVAMLYDPPLLKLGAVISLFATLIVAFGVVPVTKRR